MRAVRVLIAAVGLGLLSSSAWAQFGPPPVEKYTLNVTLTAADGQVLLKESRKCDSLEWCDGDKSDFIIAGKPRIISIRTRWNGMTLEYSPRVKNIRYTASGAATFRQDMPLRNGQVKELTIYHETPGFNPQHKDYEAPPIATLRIEVKL